MFLTSAGKSLSVEVDFAAGLLPKLLRVIDKVLISFYRLTSREDTEGH